MESPLHFLKDSARQSLKASFLAKVMSSIIGYASDYELAQFVCDLWLWSLLGGAKHASGVQMRVALAGKPFSPEYWRTRHFALLDLQKQLGYPTLFVTIAPYEWSSPYHAFLEDELLRTFKTRLHLPGPESFHLAHILTQAALGLVTGWNKKDRGGWTQQRPKFRRPGLRAEPLQPHRIPGRQAQARCAQRAPGLSWEAAALTCTSSYGSGTRRACHGLRLFVVTSLRTTHRWSRLREAARSLGRAVGGPGGKLPPFGTTDCRAPPLAPPRVRLEGRHACIHAGRPG